MRTVGLVNVGSASGQFKENPQPPGSTLQCICVHHWRGMIFMWASRKINRSPCSPCNLGHIGQDLPCLWAPSHKILGSWYPQISKSQRGERILVRPYSRTPDKPYGIVPQVRRTHTPPPLFRAPILQDSWTFNELNKAISSLWTGEKEKHICIAARLQEGVDLFTLEQPGAEPTLAEPSVLTAFCQVLWGTGIKKARLWLEGTRSSGNTKTN